TNSYKFYWFLAILDELIEGKTTILKMENLAIRMLTQVWYPLDFYKLSFGKQDSFKGIVQGITSKISIDNSINSPDLFQQINDDLNTDEKRQVNKEILGLLKWVPYRFIRPFFAEKLKGEKDYKVNKLIKQFANKSFEGKRHQSIYRFIDNHKIEVDNYWAEYFNKNQQIIRGFIYWNLLQFLQKNNPNVIGLSEKLFKPSKRDFKTAKKFWGSYLQAQKKFSCIYSKQFITNTFSIDHFLPWSYVAHDELWNLVPTLKKVNSSKNNNLPSINQYLDPFIRLQYKAFHSFYKKANGDENQLKVLESYATLFNTSFEEIAKLPQKQFKQKIKDTLIPMHQIAQNMGFSSNWTYQP
ncbi:MAG: HNH endonuclease domain-containing protein, partial [Chitinophagales bacterium]